MTSLARRTYLAARELENTVKRKFQSPSISQYHVIPLPIGQLRLGRTKASTYKSSEREQEEIEGHLDQRFLLFSAGSVQAETFIDPSQS